MAKMDSTPNGQPTTYVIESRGCQSNGARVIEPRTGKVLTFQSRKAARVYADSIASDEPSKNLPLVVVRVDDAR